MAKDSILGLTLVNTTEISKMGSNTESASISLAKAIAIQANIK